MELSLREGVSIAPVYTIEELTRFKPVGGTGLLAHRPPYPTGKKYRSPACSSG